MMLHMRFEYPISVVSFVPIHWLFFCWRTRRRWWRNHSRHPYILYIPPCLVIFTEFDRKLYWKIW